MTAAEPPRDPTDALIRLLRDPAFRAAFIRSPAAALERLGLPALGNPAAQAQRLDARESRSSLAGVLMAAAAEGLSGAGRLSDGPAPPAPPHASAPVPERAPRLAPPPRTGVVSAMRAEAKPLPVVEDARGTAATAYPGDDAAASEIAAWMAAGAERAGLPPELPVMAALQESSLRNLSGGDADSVGYFQMRVSIWDSGKYAGYARQPELQMKWFIDRALEERAERRELAASPERYGEWIAEIENPAAEYRGLYAPRLQEARALLADVPRDAQPEPGVSIEARGRTGIVAAVPNAARPATVARDLSGRIVARAAHEIGVTETSWNDAARIAEYRTATEGSATGPWCAYFVSWIAREVGVPLGDRGQGFGLVDSVWTWASASGRAVAPSAQPASGDLIVWDEHIGIVERVDPDGTIHTIEGNTSNTVDRRTYTPPAGIVGFVRLRAGDGQAAR